LKGGETYRKENRALVIQNRRAPITPENTVGHSQITEYLNKVAVTQNRKKGVSYK